MLSPVCETRKEKEEDEDEQEDAQRVKKIRQEDGQKDPLPCYFGGSDFNFEEWRDSAMKAKTTKSELFHTKIHGKLGRGEFCPSLQIFGGNQ